MTSSGFRSRVKFLSVLNPTSIVTYTSEVLDAGLLGPLFKVSYILCFYDFIFHMFIVFFSLKCAKVWHFLLCLPSFMLKYSGETEIPLGFFLTCLFFHASKKENRRRGICSAEPNLVAFAGQSHFESCKGIAYVLIVHCVDIQVTLEESPGENFTDVSATKCWDMVVQRINREIKRHNLRLGGTLPGQLLKEIDGLEMFGFLSPHVIQVGPCLNTFNQIMSPEQGRCQSLHNIDWSVVLSLFSFSASNFLFQAIEALDPKHQCTEYWNHQEQQAIPANSGDNTFRESSALGLNFCWGETSATTFDINREEDETVTPTIGMERHHQNEVQVRSALKGLLNKANPEELSVLQTIFCTDSQTTELRAEFASLIKEKQDKCR